MPMAVSPEHVDLALDVAYTSAWQVVVDVPLGSIVMLRPLLG